MQTSPNTWAPDVNQLDDGKFVMYYSATAMASPGGAHHCVGAATSDTILGPYVPLNDSLVCPLAQGGAIGKGVSDGHYDYCCAHLIRIQMLLASKTGATKASAGDGIQAHGAAGDGKEAIRTIPGARRAGRKEAMEARDTLCTR